MSIAAPPKHRFTASKSARPLARKQGAFAVYNAAGLILKRGRDLGAGAGCA